VSGGAARRGPVVVLGGGVAGLAAGYYLARGGFSVTVVERAPVVGGLCGSFQAHGFTLDHGPHKLYSVVPGILDEIRALLGDRLIEHRKRNRVRLLGRFMDYPLTLGNLMPLLGPARAAGLGLSYAAAAAGGILDGTEPRTYEDYVVRRFGRGVYELVFEPLARKVWGDPSQLSADLARARIPSGGAAELILRLLGLKETTENEDAPFFYYPRGGFGVFPQRLAEEIAKAGGTVVTSAAPVGLEREGARVRAVMVEQDGARRRLEAETVVSSIPLSALSGLLFPGDAAVAEETRQLRLRDLALVFLVLRQEKVTDDHWIFFPERRYPFNRMFEQKSMDPGLGPADRAAVCCDLTCVGAGRRAGAAVPGRAGGDGAHDPRPLRGRLRAPFPQLLPDVHRRLPRARGARLRAAARGGQPGPDRPPGHVQLQQLGPLPRHGPLHRQRNGGGAHAPPGLGRTGGARPDVPNH